MLRFLLLACLLALSTAFVAPVTPSKLTMSKIVMNDTPGVKANFQGGSFQDYLDRQKKEKEEAEKKKSRFPTYLRRTSEVQMNDTPGVKANFQGGSFQDYLDRQKKEKEEAEKKDKK